MPTTNTNHPKTPDRRPVIYARVASQDHREHAAEGTLQLDALPEPQATLTRALRAERSRLIGDLHDQEGATNG